MLILIGSVMIGTKAPPLVLRSSTNPVSLLALSLKTRLISQWTALQRWHQVGRRCWPCQYYDRNNIRHRRVPICVVSIHAVGVGRVKCDSWVAVGGDVRAHRSDGGEWANYSTGHRRVLDREAGLVRGVVRPGQANPQRVVQERSVKVRRGIERHIDDHWIGDRLDCHARELCPVADRVLSDNPVLRRPVRAITAVDGCAQLVLIGCVQRRQDGLNIDPGSTIVRPLNHERGLVNRVVVPVQGQLSTVAISGYRYDCQSVRLERRESRRYRPHHIHFFVAQDMAVVDVLPPEVHQLVYDRSSRVALRVEVVERRRRAIRHRRVHVPDRVRQLPRQLGDDRPQSDDRVLQRAHPQGFLPAQLASFGRDDDVVPGDPVEGLHVEQVEVDRVCVDAVVRDPPDLRAVGRARDGRDLDVTYRQAGYSVEYHVVLRQVGRVDKLGRRVHIRVQRGILHARRRRLSLESQGRLHPAIFVERRRVHLVVDGLRLELQAHLGRRRLQGVEAERRSIAYADEAIAAL